LGELVEIPAEARGILSCSREAQASGGESVRFKFLSAALILGIISAVAAPALLAQGGHGRAVVEVLANGSLPEEWAASAPDTVAVSLRAFARSAVAGSDVSLRVRVGSEDITDWVQLTHQTMYDYDDPDDSASVGERLDVFTVDLSQFPLSAGDTVVYEASLNAAGRRFAGASSTKIIGSSAPLAPLATDPNTCVCNFISALGASRNGSGKTHFSSGLTRNDIRAATDTLKDCLAGFKTSGHVFHCPNPGGGNPLTVLIDVQADGAGASSNVTGSADVVAAIGGDAAPGANGAGGNGTATNTQSGGASLGEGGTGGNNGASPGAGGNGTAKSTGSGGGDAVGSGGDGGSGTNTGGNGGNGSGTTTGSDAHGTGFGGDGGDPVNNGGTGGIGGNGVGSRAGTSNTGYGAGQPGGNSFGAGEHGGGGTVINTLPQPTVTNGVGIGNH
jgi:hypothetical protein